jgi:hypothetical protein
MLLQTFAVVTPELLVGQQLLVVVVMIPISVKNHLVEDPGKPKTSNTYQCITYSMYNNDILVHVCMYVLFIQ